MSEERVLNPRTNRYVTVGSSAHRKLVRDSLVKEPARVESMIPERRPVKKETTKQIKQHGSEYSQGGSDFDDTQFSHEPSKREAKRELIKTSVKVIEQNQDKFKKIVGEQDKTDMLLKKLLYQKLTRKRRPSTSSIESFDF